MIRTTVIAVTGSVGKTTAKECLATALSSWATTLKTKNNENDINYWLEYYNEKYQDGLTPSGSGLRYPETPEELFKDMSLWGKKPEGWGGKEDYVAGFVTFGEDVGC